MRRVLPMIVAIACFAPAAAGQLARPPEAATQPRAINRAVARPATPPPVTPPGTSLGWPRLLLSLGVVIAVILVLRWGGARLFGGQLAARSTRAVQVLSRSVIAPRQQLMLLQIGRRVLLVANTGGQINTLCQITDATEIADLLGQLQREKAESLTTTFTSLFHHAESKFEAPAPAETATETGTSAGPADADVATTRAELHGLMDKVRDLSRTLKG